MTEDEGVRCVVTAVRAVRGSQWITAGKEMRDRWWRECWNVFLHHVPVNVLGWITEPAEETVYDEERREVRLVVEGVARVPDCPGYPIKI